MKSSTCEKLEAGRYHDPSSKWGSTADDGLMGLFEIMGPKGGKLRIVSSGAYDGSGWEHVSVSLLHRAPNWAEMCFVKDLFWREDEVVIQYHPAKSDYINCHPHCLHLWRPTKETIPMPPTFMV
jgi:hypothetical protein